MKRSVTGACIAAMLSFGVAAYGQTTGQSQPPTTGAETQPSTRMGGDQNQAQQVTVTGCIQREADYRQAQQQGRGGAMGSGIGVGNEFVLVNASMGAGGAQSDMPGTASGTTASGTTTSGTTTSGTTTSGTTASGTTASGTTSGTASGTTSGTTSGTASGTAGTTGSGTTSDTMSGTSASGMAAGRTGGAFRLTGNREGELEKYVGQRVEIVGKIEGDAGRGAAGTSGTGTAGTGTTGAGASGTAGGGADFSSLKEIDITSFRAVGGTCQSQ